jgi:uncharacterized repeat protein (TIGR03803 family)
MEVGGVALKNQDASAKGAKQMDRSNLGRGVLSFCVAAALLAGCGVLRQAQDDMQPPIGVPGAVPHDSAFAARTSTNYNVLHRFLDGADGAQPFATLIDVHGTLYGTTKDGGTAHDGMIFSVTPSGIEKPLYSVKREPDGAFPEGALIDVKGTLYGTTMDGGVVPYSYYSDSGTVFSITKDGTEHVIHSFGRRNDGVHPVAGLIDVSGKLYGTTASGGSHRRGTVFSITTGGSEKVLYRFAAGTDGFHPAGPLIFVGGTFYGTTQYGGAYSGCPGSTTCGTVFSVTRSGVEKVLHSFAGGTDGSQPVAGLIAVGGTLYGTTSSGGTYKDGTVFSVTTSGIEKVLYSFAGGTDGSNPAAALIDVGGTLYGTTANGGGSACYTGCGTIYSISASGAETVLHAFTGDRGGANPRAGLLDVGGVLYGTTAFGGIHIRTCDHTNGCGTIFALSL